MAKAEFAEWPFLRHAIALTDSPYIKRGGDSEGMQRAVDALRDGKVLVIFPEGTIPGEERWGRHEVEAETGLLRGKTGAVRIALAAGVPLIPVGVSGTGAAFPPEVFPRLELAQPPRQVKITVRFGAPVDLGDFAGRTLEKEDLHAATQRLMLAISGLVAHERNYVPITVPVAPLPRYERLGVLLLHGFTSSVKTVDGLVPHLEAAGIPYRMPVLRGHGGHYQDLAGVGAAEWYGDAEAALLDLAQEVDKVVVVGLSMGGLVALNLAMAHADKIAGTVTLAAALRFRNPLAPVAPLLAPVVKSWPSPAAIHDQSLRHTSENYTRFPTDAFGSLLAYAKETEAKLSQVTTPVCVVHSKRDQVIAPVAANVIYEGVSAGHREIHWFTKSGHELGQDMEREAVFATVMAFVQKFRG